MSTLSVYGRTAVLGTICRADKANPMTKAKATTTTGLKANVKTKVEIKLEAQAGAETTPKDIYTHDGIS